MLITHEVLNGVRNRNSQARCIPGQFFLRNEPAFTLSVKFDHGEEILNERLQTAVLTFVAGAGLGYFLELWGTTRYCWMYYTRQTPPLFAVLAHGMAAVAFWRVGLLLKRFSAKLPGASRWRVQE